MLISLKIANLSKESERSIGLSHFFTIIFPQFETHLYHLYITAALGLNHVSGLGFL
jgi:hypothetical protein